MVQDILTYLIVGSAFAYTLWGIIGLFKPGKSSCSSGCGTCQAKSDLFNAIHKGKKPYVLR
jgi:hypothetical protein